MDIIGSDIVSILINIFLPMYLASFLSENKNKFDTKCIWLTICIIVFNIYYCIIKWLKTKRFKKVKLYSLSSVSKGEFSEEFATNLYREHKDIKEYISKGDNIDITVIRKNTNFQAISFDICRKIYDVIKECGCSDCVVTVLQRFQNEGKGKSDYVKMIAFAGKSGYRSRTYDEKYSFKVNSKNYNEFKETVFYKLFENNEDLILLKNKKEIKKNFNFLEKSRKREEKICQYIGIAIRTNRGNVEFVLQVDVSKPYVLGITKNQMKSFSDEILMPYAKLLHHLYENEMLYYTMYNKLGWRC